MDTRTLAQAPQPTRCTVGFFQANLIALGVLAIALAFVAGGHGVIWGRSAGAMLDDVFASGLFFLALGVAVIVHELLHAIGFRYIGGAPWRAIRMGIQWRTLTPFASATTAVTARSYRWVAVLPGLALGAVPAFAGVLLDAPLVSGFGVVMLAGAGGDAAILWALRRQPPDALVVDCAEALGCEVTSAGNAARSHPLSESSAGR